MIFVGDSSLHRAISEFVAHYHVERAHQGLGNELINGETTSGTGNVVVRERLVGSRIIIATECDLPPDTKSILLYLAANIAVGLPSFG